MADLMRIAYDKAENPGRAAQIGRWAKIKVHDNLKRSAIGRKVIDKTIGSLSKAIEFIPLAGPPLAKAMDAISGPLADIVKSKVFHRIYQGKLKQYEGNAYKTAKFQIKEFDLGELDRYRRKLNDSIGDLDKAWSRNADAMNSGACEGAIDIGAHYFYAQRRLNKLAAITVRLASITDNLTEWTNDVQAVLDKAAPQVEGAMIMALQLGPECHENCSKSHCGLPPNLRR